MHTSTIGKSVIVEDVEIKTIDMQLSNLEEIAGRYIQQPE